jgi:formylglycine-generating enzyme required for sulfatase activity
MRGGGYDDGADVLQVGNRGDSYPGDAYIIIGFRFARTY